MGHGTDTQHSPVVRIAIALIWSGGRLLITQRPPDTHLSGYWEFPGGKIIEDEALEECVRREVAEEVGIEVQVVAARETILHSYPERTVELHPFDCCLVSGKPRALEVADWRWVSVSQLGEYRFPPANTELIEQLVCEALDTERAE